MPTKDTMPTTLTPDIHRISDLHLALGECPIWDAQRQQLWCVDSMKGHVYAINTITGSYHSHSAPPPVGSFALNDDGSLIVALKEQVTHLDPITGAMQPLADIGISKPYLRLNDGAAMPDGSFLVGSMHIFRDPGEAPQGGLYRLTRTGQLRLEATDVAVTNGPCISPINQRLHVCDSAAKVIYSWEVDASGSLTDRRIFTCTDTLDSAPDGCCFDSDGGLWTALVHASAIVRFDVQGTITHRINLPVAHPTSLCFGGTALDTIYITSISNSGRLKAEGPLDGTILQLRGTGFCGAPRPVCHINVAAF